MSATCPQVQELLETLCSEVSISNENDAQCIFLLGTAQQARLAYDVLVVHGLDVRLYPENDTAKLYITKPIDADRLAAALTQAETVGNVMDAMEISHSDDYRISFTNTPTQGKQISIYFPPPPVNPATSSPQAIAASAQLQSRIQRPPATRNKHIRRRKKAAFLAAGPTVAKKSFLGGKRDGNDLNLKLSDRIKNFFISNFFESFYAFLIMAFLALLTVSIFITFKGYFCFDLATAGNNAWYCNLRNLR